MTSRRNAAPRIRTGRKPPGAPASGTGASTGRRSRVPGAAVLGAAVLGAAALAVAGALTAGSPARPANASVTVNCAAAPSSCGYPDATNTGVPGGTILQIVPAQASSGPGWYYNAAINTVIVNVNGTVLSGLFIPCTLQVSASSVTVSNVQIMTGGNFGISLTHTTGVTIQNSTISGQNPTTGRVGSAIDDVYGDSTGMVIKNNNISNFKTAIQISTGLVDGNYVHDPGYVAGDHTNGFYVNGGTQPLTISDNTIFDSLGQTDAINLDAGTPGPAAPVASKTVVNNLLAGGSYTIYGGAPSGSPTSNIVIQGNRFGQLFYPKAGQYGPVAYFDSTGTGNIWSGNVWDNTGTAIPSP